MKDRARCLEDVLNEIRRHLQAGMRSEQVAELLGRQGSLDYGEIVGIKVAAMRIQNTLTR